jgi:hypothetical protein
MLFRSTHAVVATGAVSAALKMLIHRYRPLAAGEPLLFSGPSSSTVDVAQFSRLDLSLPCGHVAVTVAFASVIEIHVRHFVAYPL